MDLCQYFLHFSPSFGCLRPFVSSLPVALQHVNSNYCVAGQWKDQDNSNCPALEQGEGGTGKTPHRIFGRKPWSQHEMLYMKTSYSGAQKIETIKECNFSAKVICQFNIIRRCTELLNKYVIILKSS